MLTPILKVKQETFMPAITKLVLHNFKSFFSCLYLLHRFNNQG